MYYTYVLVSWKDGNRYVGFTKDLDLRMKQHQLGRVRSTAHRRPLVLIYFEACLSKDDGKISQNPLGKNVYRKAPQSLAEFVRGFVSFLFNLLYNVLRYVNIAWVLGGINSLGKAFFRL